MNQTRQPDPLYGGSRQASSQYRSDESSMQNSSEADLTSPEGIRARAERFEDEKRRIIESAFAKKDDDGSQVESYITHVKVRTYDEHV